MFHLSGRKALRRHGLKMWATSRASFPPSRSRMSSFAWGKNVLWTFLAFLWPSTPHPRSLRVQFRPSRAPCHHPENSGGLGRRVERWGEEGEDRGEDGGEGRGEGGEEGGGEEVATPLFFGEYACFFFGFGRLRGLGLGLGNGRLGLSLSGGQLDEFCGGSCSPTAGQVCVCAHFGEAQLTVNSLEARRDPARPDSLFSPFSVWRCMSCAASRSACVG